MNGPSRGQQRVLAFIARFTREHRYAPSLRDICDALGWSGLQAATDAVGALVKKGLVTKRAKMARSIVITEQGRTLLIALETRGELPS